MECLQIEIKCKDINVAMLLNYTLFIFTIIAKDYDSGNNICLPYLIKVGTEIRICFLLLIE